LIEVTRMDIEDSSVPYRAFLRSGSYPAMTERFVRSGGVLVRAAGWAALVVGAASAGYNTTQRLVTPSAAEPSLATAQAALVAEAPVAHAVPALEPVHEMVDHDMSAEAMDSALHPSALAQATLRTASGPARKRTGAIQPEAHKPAASNAEVEIEASRSEASRAEQIAERVRALDDASRASHAEASEEVKTASAVSAAVESVLREASPREEAGVTAKTTEPPALRGADVYAKLTPPSPRAPKVEAALPPTPTPAASQQLAAAARIDGLFVRGPLSAAHVRRSVERVRPTLTECYGEAARQAGRNRFAPVRVQVTIDEAGRVKAEPKIDGAQLPGLGECLGAAMSKLVCQAPDTGTAWASITLGFVPERR
jgi:hypothetical protein